jgi:hypothetical protein
MDTQCDLILIFKRYERGQKFSVEKSLSSNRAKENRRNTSRKIPAKTIFFSISFALVNACSQYFRTGLSNCRKCAKKAFIFSRHDAPPAFRASPVGAAPANYALEIVARFSNLETHHRTYVFTIGEPWPVL